MKFIKKFLLLSFSLLLIFVLVACEDSNSSESEDLETNKQQVEEKLVELANNGGYEITYQYTSSDVASTSFATIGANGAYNWYYTGEKEEGIAFEKYNGLTLYYVLKNGVWTYQYAYEYDANSSKYNMDLTSQFGMFLQAYEFEDNLKKAKTGIVAGRTCDVYSYSVNAKGQIIQSLVGVDATWSYYIDKETGICLKFEVSGDDGTNKSSASFEVTEFKTNATLTGLKHPSDVYPINSGDPNVTGNWNMLTFVGLNSIAPDKELLVSDDVFHSTETLGVGFAIYYFKVLEVFDFDDAQGYMADYYGEVVRAIKATSDDHKCYNGDNEDTLEEVSEVLDSDTINYSFIFKYHDQLYLISFMIDDAVDYDVNCYLLMIEVNRADE